MWCTGRALEVEQGNLCEEGFALARASHCSSRNAWLWEVVAHTYTRGVQRYSLREKPAATRSSAQ